MFFEIVGESSLLDRLDLDRDDAEEAIEEALGADGEMTGAGTGMGRWHLDVELESDEFEALVVARIANALVGLGLGAVSLRREDQEEGLPARDLAG